MWVYNAPPPDELAHRESENWIKVPCYDIPEEGDVHKIAKWSSKHTLD